MSTIVVDTDVVSFQFKRDSRAALYDRFLAGQTLALSFMTVAELDRWMLQKRWGRLRCQRMEQHLRNFVIVFADRNLCRWWAEVCNRARSAGYTILSADAWIAAVALAMDAPLVTHNSADYQGIRGLTVLSA